MQEDVQKILSIIQEKKRNLINFKKKTEEEIESLEDDLRKVCSHDWQIDYSNRGEKTEYICLKCTLYKV